jgi:hypothetical protein
VGADKEVRIDSPMVLLDDLKECLDVILDLEGVLHHHVFDLPNSTT